MQDFRKLQMRHYQATCRRNKINKKTTFADFLEAATNEDVEATMAYDKSGHEWTQEVVQEKIDAIAVRINELTHNNIDFIAEYKKNTIHQETRED